jgi:3-hydroxybutyryl-CoA dehydrogenase
MERIAVVGAGLMGHGIAQVFACAGYEVRVTDSDPEALASLHGRIADNLAQLGDDPAPAHAVVVCHSLAEAVDSATFVFEAIAESLPLKQGLFEELGRLVGADTILASNTSVMSIGEIGATCSDPGRVVGTHWWNPPYLIPLVEVVEAESTRPETVERTLDLLERVGKEPVHVLRDVPGFVGNRLQHALWREAIALVDAGVCEAETVDRVVKRSFGLRLSVLGPLENADLVGLDLTLAIHDYVLPHLDSTPGPSPLLRRLVEEGALGMRTGRGFYAWSTDEAQSLRVRLRQHLASVHLGSGR